MPDLDFKVEGVEALPHAASPHLLFRIAVEQQGGPPLQVENVLLHAQLRIQPHLRRYDAGDRERLSELFGREEQWSRTLHSMLWTHVDTVVPRFTGRTVVAVPVPCTFDFNVAATRYFDGLGEGDVPLCLLFSGTVFYADPQGTLRIALIAWDREASHRLPLGVWKEMMDHYYPNSAWLRLGKDVFDRLQGYRRRSGAPSWEQTFERLLDESESRSAP